MTSKVLVGIDGSEASRAATEYAMKLVKASGWELLLLHVMEEGKAIQELGERAKTERLAEPVDQTYLDSKLGPILKQTAPEIWLKGIKYSTKMEIGDPSTKILQAAKASQAEMIVVGFVGLRGVQRIRALGSVSRALLENSSIPVLVVPQRNSD